MLPLYIKIVLMFKVLQAEMDDKRRIGLVQSSACSACNISPEICAHPHLPGLVRATLLNSAPPPLVSSGTATFGTDH